MSIWIRDTYGSSTFECCTIYKITKSTSWPFRVPVLMWPCAWWPSAHQQYNCSPFVWIQLSLLFVNQVSWHHLSVYLALQWNYVNTSIISEIWTIVTLVMQSFISSNFRCHVILYLGITYLILMINIREVGLEPVWIWIYWAFDPGSFTRSPSSFKVHPVIGKEKKKII